MRAGLRLEARGRVRLTAYGSRLTAAYGGRGSVRAVLAHGGPRRYPLYSDRMTTLEAALERIVAVAQPDRVILFGSAARGTAGPQSDLDFLVIKRGVTRGRQLAQAIYRALVGIRASIDVVVITPEDVESLRDGVGTIVGPAIREGREVYAA